MWLLSDCKRFIVLSQIYIRATKSANFQQGHWEFFCHFNRVFAPKCASCNQPILPAQVSNSYYVSNLKKFQFLKVFRRSAFISHANVTKPICACKIFKPIFSKSVCASPSQWLYLSICNFLLFLSLFWNLCYVKLLRSISSYGCTKKLAFSSEI